MGWPRLSSSRKRPGIVGESRQNPDRARSIAVHRGRGAHFVIDFFSHIKEKWKKSVTLQEAQMSEITIKEACDLAMIDRARFNEAVAAGHYDCAPEAVHGRPRMFDENDTIALVSYGMRLKEGWPPRLAGHFSCLLRRELSGETENQNAVTITVGFPGDRQSDAQALEFDPEKQTKAGKDIHYQMVVNVKKLREYVRGNFATEA